MPKDGSELVPAASHPQPSHRIEPGEGPSFHYMDACGTLVFGIDVDPESKPNTIILPHKPFLVDAATGNLQRLDQVKVDWSWIQLARERIEDWLLAQGTMVEWERT